MLTATILIILGVLLVVVLRQMMRAPGDKRPAVTGRQAPAALASAPELHSVRQGDVVSVHAAAQDFSDLDFTVDRRSAYESNGRRWIDISGDFRGHRVYLEVQPGDQPDVMGILDPRKLTLNDINLTEDRLIDLDSRQDPSQFIEFEGRRWHYESSREIGYFENEQGQGEGLYRWLFQEQGGKRLLCIEKWEGQPFDVRVALRINPQDVTVYRAA